LLADTRHWQGAVSPKIALELTFLIGCAGAVMVGHRILLVVLLVWALLMIVPDLWRVVQPLGSFGFDTDNDGLIYDVTGPFPDRTASPAWKAGLREGDHLDLSRLRCISYDAATCGNALALLVLPYVVPGRTATVYFTSRNGETREVTLVAEEEPANFLVRAVQLIQPFSPTCGIGQMPGLWRRQCA
jgi:hypothetical protein